MSDVYLQAETTVSSRQEAERLGAELVRRRLAACAQIVGPIRSLYWWKDEIQNDEEFLILFKTRQALAGEFLDALNTLHSYDVPEVLFFSVVDGARSYLAWLSGETGGKSPGGGTV